jgi:hypothetical protein
MPSSDFFTFLTKGKQRSVVPFVKVWKAAKIYWVKGAKLLCSQCELNGYTVKKHVVFYLDFKKYKSTFVIRLRLSIKFYKIVYICNRKIWCSIRVDHPVLLYCENFNINTLKMSIVTFYLLKTFNYPPRPKEAFTAIVSYALIYLNSRF